MSWTIPSSHSLRRTESSPRDSEHVSPIEMLRSESAVGRPKAEPFVDLSRSFGATVPLGCNSATSRCFEVQIKDADSEPRAISAPIRNAGRCRSRSGIAVLNTRQAGSRFRLLDRI
jgi:hypothetical protein